MSAMILDGRMLAAKVRAEVAERVGRLRAAGVVPGLAVVLAGDDPASRVYVRNKARAAAEVGIDARTLRYPEDVSPSTLGGAIEALNADPSIHGILVQLPLPASASASESALLDRVEPGKDVDGFHPVNLGRLVAGRPGFVACTPTGCMRLLAAGGVEPAGKRAVVVGRSVIVGQPVAQLLLRANATVTIAHSRTVDLPGVVRGADIVIAAVGRAGLIRGDWLRPGAAVIDVGINRGADGKLVGDVDFEEAREVAGSLTPVPGGVGPMTIACLMENVCLAAEIAAGHAPGR